MMEVEDTDNNYVNVEEEVELYSIDKFYCGICYCEYDIEENDIKMLEKCGHSFCTDCFQETFRSCIEDQNKHHNLECPQQDCQNKPTAQEIREIISEDCFSKYVKFQSNLKVAQSKNLFYCPTTDCEGTLDSKKAQKSLIDCAICHKQVCVKCKMFSHVGKSCSSNQRDQLQDWAAQGMDVHSCPRCKAPIQKNGGCPQMTCANCQYRWCWVCGFEADYNDPKFRFHSILVFPCNFISLVSACPWYIGIPWGIILTISAPILMFLILLIMMIGTFSKRQYDKKTCIRKYFWMNYNHRSVFRRGYMRPIYTVCVCIPFWSMISTTMALLSLVITMLFGVFLYLIIIFIYLRMIYWWHLRRRIRYSQESDKDCDQDIDFDDENYTQQKEDNESQLSG